MYICITGYVCVMQKPQIEGSTPLLVQPKKWQENEFPFNKQDEDAY